MRYPHHNDDLNETLNPVFPEPSAPIMAPMSSNSKLVTEAPKKRQFSSRSMCTSCLGGALFMILLEASLFYAGIISLPDSGQEIVQPECYGCVNMPPLCGAYVSVADQVEAGVEMMATTTCKYEGGLTATTVTVQKDPLNLLSACDCSGVPLTMGAVNCSLTWQNDACTDECYANNMVDPHSIVAVYNPDKDEVYVFLCVSVLCMFMRLSLFAILTHHPPTQYQHQHHQQQQQVHDVRSGHPAAACVHHLRLRQRQEPRS